MRDPATVVVCFACRKRLAERTSGPSEVCPDCSGASARISSRLPLPPQENVRGWDALREVCDAE